MLSVFAKTFRVKAAIALAALYTLCILAPSAAFAFSASPGSPGIATTENRLQQLATRDFSSSPDGGAAPSWSW